MFIRCLTSTIVALTIFPFVVLAEDMPTDNETCLMCHEGYDKGLSPTKHRLTPEPTGSSIIVECRSCHTTAGQHVDDPTEDNIGNPAKALAAEAERVCTNCHQPHLEAGVAGYDPHFGQDISCTSCHRIHATNTTLLVDEESGFCGECHVSAVNKFRKRSNHPLTDQALTCMSCHDFTGRNDVNLGHGGNANCYQCHPEQSGPYLFEHEATSSFSTEGVGCISCHQPHGSSNERLLAQPGDHLCLQCHGTPPRHFTQHGGIGSQYLCVECHSDVHGSYSNRAFLDPQLGTNIGDYPGSCFCHEVIN